MARHVGMSVLIVLAVASVGCSSAGPTLLEVPEPGDLEGMNSSVRSQYEGVRRELDRLLAQPSPAAEELAEAFGELGLWHHAYLLHDSAELAYRNARTLAPHNPDWSYYLAAIATSRGRTGEARAALEEVLALSPNDAPALVRLAEIELGEGEAEAARERFEQALALDETVVRALVGVARACLELGEPQRAFDLLQEARALQPGSGQIRYALGLALRDLGELEKAEAFLATVEPDVRLDDLWMPDPRQARLLEVDVGFQGNLRRAQEAGRAGRHGVALQYFQAASAADPTSVIASLGVSRSLHAMGRIDEARVKAFATLEQFPDSALAHNGVAIRLLASGRREEARSHFQTALSLRSDSLPALRGLGVLLTEDGELARAADYFRQARGLGLTEELAERNAGVLIGLERYGEARAALEEDLLVLEGSRKLSLLLARLLAASPDADVRDGQQALALAREAFTASPGLDAAEVLVAALAELGDLEAAAAGQRRLIAAVEHSGRRQLLPRLERRLARLESGRPDRDPTPRAAGLSSIFVDPAPFEALLPEP